MRVRKDDTYKNGNIHGVHLKKYNRSYFYNTTALKKPCLL